VITRRHNGDAYSASLEEIQRELQTEEEINSAHHHNTSTNNYQQRRQDSTFGKGNQKKKYQKYKWGSKSNHNGNQQGKSGPESKCRHHPNHDHKWGDCIYSIRSANYNANAAEKWKNRNNNSSGGGSSQKINGHNNKNNSPNQRPPSYGGPTHQGHYHASFSPVPTGYPYAPMPQAYFNQQASHRELSFGA
jgi:hypothetical protein